MALVVGYEQDQDGNYDNTFHVGSGRIAKTCNTSFGTGSNLIVQADGHELEHIKQQFQNIPLTHNRVVRWTGEYAKFIVNNIEL
jgi:hypothetical protein